VEIVTLIGVVSLSRLRAVIKKTSKKRLKVLA
jgi:hypothetical protein